MRIVDILNRIVTVEEINGADDCPTYLYRWRLLKIGWIGIYLQHFIGDDWSLDLHDHPRRFISFGLWGRYLEETPHGSRWYVAPWIRTFPAKHIHRIIQPKNFPILLPSVNEMKADTWSMRMKKHINSN